MLGQEGVSAPELLSSHKDGLGPGTGAGWILFLPAHYFKEISSVSLTLPICTGPRQIPENCVATEPNLH